MGVHLKDALGCRVVDRSLRKCQLICVGLITADLAKLCRVGAFELLSVGLLEIAVAAVGFGFLAANRMVMVGKARG